MSSETFQKRIEDFVCGKCGAEVRGNGYTNHCSRCLWSRHVDIHPGDRLASCGALMEPVSAFLEQGEWQLVHRCTLCGHEKKNRLSGEDDQSALIQLFGEK